MNLYDFTVKTRKGADVALSDFAGKVVMVVNTATGCGFTPQYKELQEIYDAFKDKGFENARETSVGMAWRQASQAWAYLERISRTVLR